MTNWHFTDQPFFDEGFTKDVPFEYFNVEWAIQDMHDSIVDPIGIVYGPPQDIEPVDPMLSRSFNMRLLIHYFGDIHQPLHSVSRFTANYPDGDAGGNLFPIPASGLDGGVTNLHSVWDSVGYAYDMTLQQPLSDEDWVWLGQQAFKITMNNSYDSFEDLGNPETEWATEGLNIAKAVVYPGVQENVMPSDEYVALAQATAERQIAKGGYRLADYLILLNEEMIDLGIYQPQI